VATRLRAPPQGREVLQSTKFEFVLNPANGQSASPRTLEQFEFGSPVIILSSKRPRITGIRGRGSMIRRRSVTVAGHKTSISLEGAFWQGLRDIAEDHHTSLPRLIARIDGDRQQFANLSSAIRMFVLRHFRDQVHQRGRSVTDVSFQKEGASALGMFQADAEP
jgi:predicted DNA-binding ribbon-helix-helix protein